MNKPLILVIEEAKGETFVAINSIIRKHNLSCAFYEPIIAEIHRQLEDGKGSTPWESQKGWTTETNFYVTNTGFLKATNAEIEGKITANKGGKIGGWTLSSAEVGGFLSSTGDMPLYLFGDGEGTAKINGTEISNLTFRIGKKKDTSINGADTATFGITSDGKVYGSGVDLSGTLIATAVKSNREIDAWDDGLAYANGFHILGDIAD